VALPLAQDGERSLLQGGERSLVEDGDRSLGMNPGMGHR